MKKITLLSLFLAVAPLALLGQWEKVKNIPPPYDKNYWLEVYFLPQNPDYGWVCGFEGRVLRTTDRGRTWRGSTILSANQLEHIQFPSEKVGYTSGIGINGFGKIYKSTDGGATWFDITPPNAEDLWGHYFVDDNYGLVIGGGCLTPQRFYITTDGGRSWTYSEYNVPNSGLTDLILYSKTGLGFATSSGWIWKTENGGRSWSLFSKSGENDWQEDLWIFGNTILVPYSLDCSGGGGSGGVRISKNLGKSWKQFSTGSSMFGGFLLDSLRGWVCGWNTAVYYTSDGGNFWELLNCGIDPGSSLDDFWFIDDTTGWVVGTGIYKFVGKKIITAEIEAPTSSACEGDTIVLRAKNNTQFYHWSNNQNSREIKVTKSGVYELYAWNTDCDSVIPSKITVTFNPKPVVQLSVPENMKICDGDTLPIWFTTDANEHIWSSGSKADTIFIYTAGRYSVYVRNEFGCIDSASVNVVVAPNPKPKIQFSSKTSICQGDSVVLTLPNIYTYVEWFEVNNPDMVLSTNSTFITKNSGNFFARTETIDGCFNVSDTIVVDVRIDSNAIQILLGNNQNIMHFDSIRIRNSKCLDLILKNVSNTDVSFDYLFIKGNVSFSTLPSLFPIKLSPGESKAIPICFLPHKLGTERDTIVIFDRCWDQYVYLIAESVPEYYSGISGCDVPVFGKTRTFDEYGKSWDLHQILISSILSIKISLDSGEKLVLINTLGETLFSFENNDASPRTFELDFSNYPNGLYFIYLIDQRKHIVKNSKIILTR